jgi:IS1 family transposase
MSEIAPLCIRCVDGIKTMVKYGKTKSGKQRYICKYCKKSQVEKYSYTAYNKSINRKIVTLTKEGLGIRSTARVLKISTTTLLKRIIHIAKSITSPAVPLGKTYEVDEIRLYLKRKDKLIWIVYSLERDARKVVNFNVGERTNKTLSLVLNTLVLSKAKAIFTDKLRQYKYLLNKTIHKVKPFGTNHIERFHLTLRTHLKRLNRKTICFSRNSTVLYSILKIYFWY